MTTRFELANITSKIGSFASKPTYGALETVFNCISYLRGVQYQVLQVSIHVEDDMVEMMCDADWATLDVGLAKRTSTLGVILLLNGAPVAWKATNHSNSGGLTSDCPMTMGVLSVAESELYAMSALCQNLMGLNLHYVLEEMGIMARPSPIIAHTDSEAAMGFAKGSGKKTKIRHIDQRMEWVKELKDINLFQWVHVPSAINKADILTKVLDKVKFQYAMDYILKGVVPPEHLQKLKLKEAAKSVPVAGSTKQAAQYATLIKESSALSHAGLNELTALMGTLCIR